MLELIFLRSCFFPHELRRRSPVCGPWEVRLSTFFWTSQNVKQTRDNAAKRLKMSCKGNTATKQYTHVGDTAGGVLPEKHDLDKRWSHHLFNYFNRHWRVYIYIHIIHTYKWWDQSAIQVTRQTDQDTSPIAQVTTNTLSMLLCFLCKEEFSKEEFSWGTVGSSWGTVGSSLGTVGISWGTIGRSCHLRGSYRAVPRELSAVPGELSANPVT